MILNPKGVPKPSKHSRLRIRVEDAVAPSASNEFRGLLVLTAKPQRAGQSHGTFGGRRLVAAEPSHNLAWGLP